MAGLANQAELDWCLLLGEIKKWGTLLLTVFFVNRKSGIVEFIVMADNDFVIRALPNVAIGDNRPYSYWTTCTREELEPYLSIDYEVWVDDLSSESDEPGSGADIDPYDGLASQIEPVQMWAKGESVSLGLIKFRSEFVGFGSGFVFEEVAAGFPEIRPKRASTYVRPAKSKDHRDCPWCGVSAIRSYNFTRQYFGRESEMPGKMQNPVLWTDGAWSEEGVDPNCSEFTENQYGDCVVVCPACDSLFLASAIEEKKAPHYLFGEPLDKVIVQGKLARNHFEDVVSEEWIFTATLNQTMEYLEDALKKDRPFWCQWTATQQVVNWITHLERCGEQISPAQDAKGRDLLARFIPSTYGMKEGIFGSYYNPFLVDEESQDENYWIHDFTLDELLPFKNIRRIVGDWHELSYHLDSPVSDIRTFEEFQNKRMPNLEFDDYIVARLILIRTLIERKDTRWAVHSGELLEGLPSGSPEHATIENARFNLGEAPAAEVKSEFALINKSELHLGSVLEAPPENIQEEMRTFLDVLHPRESAVLSARFGLRDDRPKSYIEIAGELGVGPERIQQIESETLERLRGLKLSLELLEFLG